MKYSTYEAAFQELIANTTEKEIRTPQRRIISNKILTPKKRVNYCIVCKYCKAEINLGEVSKHGKGVCT
jgi:hypothetical protein